MPSRLIALRSGFENSRDYTVLHQDVDRAKYFEILDRYLSVDMMQRYWIIYSFTKREVEELIQVLPGYLLERQDADLFIFLVTRHRRYVFRRMYTVWQDNYDNKMFCALFARLLLIGSSEGYARECGYSPDDLREIVVSPNPGQVIVERAQNASMSLLEYFRQHQYQIGCRLAQDSMSIFYLFCSARDYDEIGDQRLSTLVGRFSNHVQHRILKNMQAKLPAARLRDFPLTISRISRLK